MAQQTRHRIGGNKSASPSGDGMVLGLASRWWSPFCNEIVGCVHQCVSIPIAKKLPSFPEGVPSFPSKSLNETRSDLPSNVHGKKLRLPCGRYHKVLSPEVCGRAAVAMGRRGGADSYVPTLAAGPVGHSRKISSGKHHAPAQARLVGRECALRQ